MVSSAILIGFDSYGDEGHLYSGVSIAAQPYLCNSPNSEEQVLYEYG